MHRCRVQVRHSLLFTGNKLENHYKKDSIIIKKEKCDERSGSGVNDPDLLLCSCFL